MGLTRRTGLECLAAFVLGIFVLVVPAAFDPNPYPAKFLPLIATAVEGVGFWTLIALVALGIGLGLVSKAPAFLLAVCAVLIFPLWSAADIASGGDHNLLPFEWLIYGFYMILVHGSIIVARFARRHVALGT